MADERSITQIPLPGSSGRIPTGAMQFQDDWPGLFVRGDDSIALLFAIRDVEGLLREKCNSRLPNALSRIADVIERDVIVRADS